MDGHHLGVHAERRVGMVAAACPFEGNERLDCSIGGSLGLLLLLHLLLSLLQLFLQIGNSLTIKCALGNVAMLQRRTLETVAVVIVAFTDDLAAAHNDAAMAVVEWGLGGLLEAKGEVVFSLHFAVSGSCERS